MIETFAFIAVLMAAPPAAPAPTVDPELERALGQDAQAQAAAQAQKPTSTDAPAAMATPAAPAGGFSLNPDMSVILDVAAAAFSEDQPRQAGGHDPAKNGFTLQQVELAASKAVDPYFRFDAFLVLSQFGIEVEEAYATTTTLPGSLQLRAGQFLTRFGRQNPTHPHSWEFADQPFMWSRVFGGEGNRGPGVELSWLSPLPWYLELLVSTTDAAGEATARSFWGAEDLGVHSLFDLQQTLAVKQFFPLSDDLSLLWGLSGAFGPNPTGHGNRSEVYGTDLYLKYRPITVGSHTVVSLQTEALYRRRQVPDDVLQDGGGYAQLLWRWARRFASGARYEWGSPVWNRDGEVANDYLDPLWAGHRQRVSLATTFWPTEFSRLRLQGSMDSTSGPDPTVWAVMFALEVSAGAHGAHAF
jgi:hypothetical protein